MTISFKERIFDLVSEFLTHTFVFRNAFQSAGAVAACSFQTLFDGLDDLLILIERNLHNPLPPLERL